MPQYADDVRNPDTPYIGPLSESGIRPGCKIVVKGKVEEGADRSFYVDEAPSMSPLCSCLSCCAPALYKKIAYQPEKESIKEPPSFSINLQCGADQDPKPDVAFHLNPRFGGGVIVRNSFQGGWGDEERDLDEDFPFAEGENFTVIIHVGKAAYNVVIKGKKMLRYAHRVEDLSLVDTIRIGGDVTIRAVEVSEGGYLEYPFEEAQHVICRPEIPFEGGVPFGHLQPGSKIIIQGRVKEGPERFHINLVAGEDKAFHFNPRFGGEVVVRNTKQGGGWGDEERECEGDFPFKEGEDFEIAILCRRRRFQIFVNSKMFCFFNHRIEDLTTIDSLQVKGDVEIHAIQLQEKSKLHMMPFRDGSFFLGGELPFVVPLPDEMSNGTMISVCGIVNEDPDRFHINLMTGEEDADVAFHFNPRFNAGAVVRNSKEDGGWKGEEKEDDGGFPFEANCYFQVLIGCEEDCYKVAVNGKHFLDFNHRIPCDKVTHLKVNGAIRLVSVRIE